MTFHPLVRTLNSSKKMASADRDGHFSYIQRILNSTGGRFRWPDQVILYCLPPEHELLLDKARRLAFQAYLLLSKLPFTTKFARNTESMSPEGKSPFLVLQLGSHPLILGNFEKMVSFLNAQHLGLGSNLEELEKVDQEAFLSLVNVRIVQAQQYQTWANKDNLSETLKVSGCGLSWPLGTTLPYLSLLHYVWNYWSDFRRSRGEVMKGFEQACTSLSERLGKEEYFFSSKLSTLDVMVFSHLQAILSRHLPSSELLKILQQHQNLTDFCQRMSSLQELADLS